MGFPIGWLQGNANYPKARLKDFKVIKKIGNGRYGVCYLAENNLGQLVVIKRLRAINFERSLENIKYEVMILASLDDERIPEVIGVINEDNFKGYVMSYIKGDTLSKLVKEDKYRFTKREIYSLGSRLIDIVRYLHEEGVVHNDIRSPNIIINEKEVYLIDFGLARWVDWNGEGYLVDYSFLGKVLVTILGTRVSEEREKLNISLEEKLGLNYEQSIFIRTLEGTNFYFGSIYEIQDEFDRLFRIY